MFTILKLIIAALIVLAGLFWAIMYFVTPTRPPKQ
jgi:cytochrome c-type biogenesis protein CcmE